MSRRKRTQPGDLIYLSSRKLYDGAAQLGIKTGSFEPVAAEGGSGAKVGVGALGASANATVRAAYSDPGGEERQLHEHLRQFVKKLGPLPDLEQGDRILAGGFFSFERQLRCGVGHSDAGAPLKALIVVDTDPIDNPATAGLLLNGSVAHVRDPYATEELRQAMGSRSGSGTERLFNWLEEVRRGWEADPDASLRTIVSRITPAPRGAQTALSMYRLFAREDWMAPYLAEPLMHQIRCEGVARASFIAVDDELTVVMGSPLYIRACMPRDSNEGDGLLSRMFRRTQR